MNNKKKTIMNNEHQEILDLLERHFNETPLEELEAKSKEFYNPFGNEITVNEYFNTFADNHGFLQDLEKNSISDTQLSFEDEGQHEEQQMNVFHNKLTAIKIDVKLDNKDTTHSQIMYYSAA